MLVSATITPDLDKVRGRTPTCQRLQSCVLGDATSRAGGCSPTCQGLQPHVPEAAALCARGGDPLCCQVTSLLLHNPATVDVRDDAADGGGSGVLRQFYLRCAHVDKFLVMYAPPYP